ncbi:MAG: YceH family protein [bacterium]
MAKANLTASEARVLGSLIEKAITTPEYYPLSINALTNACNQKSSRDPVLDMDIDSVMLAMGRLKQKQLAYETFIGGNRVPKYGHRIREVFDFSPQEIAMMCVLLLRGPQTPGELRSRTERLCQFKDLAEVEATLAQLMNRESGPLVVKLPRQFGRKECRYAHLLCGEVRVDEPAEQAVVPVGADDDRIAALEKQVETLRAELDELKKRLQA